MRLHIFHHLGTSMIRMLTQLDRIEKNTENTMALSPEVQAQADAVKALTGVVASVDAGIKAMQAQIATLQGQINSAPSLSAEDKAALLQSVADTNALATQLQADIPANTAAAAPPPSGAAPGTSTAS